MLLKVRKTEDCVATGGDTALRDRKDGRARRSWTGGRVSAKLAQRSTDGTWGIFMNAGQTRLERALERHRDAVLVEHHPGRQTVVRRDQVLADPDEVRSLDDDLARWTRGREDGPGATRYHLRPEAGVDVGELVAEMRAGSGRTQATVSPNHLLRAEPAWWVGPEGVPTPAPATAPPPMVSPVTAATVAVLDTGLAPHPWFDERDWYVAQRSLDIAEVLDADRDYELDNLAGHGTFIAGVVLQHAPGAELLIRRVLGSDGISDEFNLVRALHELREYRDRHGSIDLVNLSLGCYTFDDAPTPVMERAIGAFGDATVFVSCAGNDGSDRPFWPAALDAVVGVAALDAHGRDRAEFSNYGDWVDACAVGEDVHSSFVTFDGPQPPVGGTDSDRFRGYARWSGTSFATPAVAGAIAARCMEWQVPAAQAARELLDGGTARVLDELGAVVTS